MRIVFEEPEILHPNSETVTVFDVARFLESKYHVCQNFIDYIAEALYAKLAKFVVGEMFQSSERELFIIEQWLRDQWREYIIEGKHDIVTEAASVRNDPSFVDTSAYYLNMQIRLVGDKVAV